MYLIVFLPKHGLLFERTVCLEFFFFCSLTVFFFLMLKGRSYSLTPSSGSCPEGVGTCLSCVSAHTHQRLCHRGCPGCPLWVSDYWSRWLPTLICPFPCWVPPGPLQLGLHSGMEEETCPFFPSVNLRDLSLGL